MTLLRRVRLFLLIVFRTWEGVRLWPRMAWKVAGIVHGGGW